MYAGMGVVYHRNSRLQTKLKCQLDSLIVSNKILELNSFISHLNNGRWKVHRVEKSLLKQIVFF